MKEKGKVKVVGKTPSGKEIGYREVGHSRYKEAAFKDGGELPEELKGNWTDPRMLEDRIQVYINRMEANFAKETKKALAKKKVQKVK